MIWIMWGRWLWVSGWHPLPPKLGMSGIGTGNIIRGITYCLTPWSHPSPCFWNRKITLLSCSLIGSRYAVYPQRCPHDHAIIRGRPRWSGDGKPSSATLTHFVALVQTFSSGTRRRMAFRRWLLISNVDKDNPFNRRFPSSILLASVHHS